MAIKLTAGRLSTDTVPVPDLLLDLKKGEIKVPQFQRKFVWSEEQALNLLDSIANNYPIGSLLFWRTPDKLVTERNIGDFRLPDTEELTPTSYVLDGQQRLTTIYSCLGAPEDDSGFAAGFDLAKQRFIALPKTENPLVLPLRRLLDTTKLLDFRTALHSYVVAPQLVAPDSSDAQLDAKELQASLDNLIRAFSNYKIPVVTLKDMTVEEVCPIFERINSSGTRLSTFDLMVAATWSKNFDLNDRVARIAKSLDGKGFGDIEGTTVLKCLAAIEYGSIRKDDILSLRETKGGVEPLVERTQRALQRAVDLLSTELRIHTLAFVPYEAHAVILCYLFAQIEHMTGEMLQRIRQWFWRSALSERYRGSSDTFVSRDLTAVRRHVVEGTGEVEQFGAVPSESALIASVFRSNNSRSRAFVLLLAGCAPRNLTNGALIDTAESLSCFNQRQYHHVFPRAFLERIGRTDDAHSIVNICLLAASQNRNVSDRDPSEYLPECTQKLGSVSADVFRSNLLPDPSEWDYRHLDYSMFLELRAAMLRERMEALAAGV